MMKKITLIKALQLIVLAIEPYGDANILLGTDLISVSGIENDGLLGVATCCSCSGRLCDGKLGLFLVKLVIIVFLKDDLLPISIRVVDDLNCLSASRWILDDLDLV